MIQDSQVKISSDTTEDFSFRSPCNSIEWFSEDFNGTFILTLAKNQSEGEDYLMSWFMNN